MSSIFGWGRHSKFDHNSTLPWGNLIWHSSTSLGRFDFWQGKWTPNHKIQVVLESRLKYLSNELSCTQFWHREGLHKSPAKECDAQEEERDDFINIFTPYGQLYKWQRKEKGHPRHFPCLWSYTCSWCWALHLHFVTLRRSISSWHILYIVCKPFAKAIWVGWLVTSGGLWERNFTLYIFIEN